MSKTIAAGIFIVRKDKKILICHPTNHKPDFWSIPKGKVDNGETFSIPDKTKVADLLQKELFRREAPQNLKDAIELKS